MGTLNDLMFVSVSLLEDFHHDPRQDILKNVQTLVAVILHVGNKEIILQINRAVDASPELRSKKALIEQFLKTINSQSVVGSDWEKFVAAQKEKEIGLIIQEHKLKDAETRKFIDNCFRDGAIKTIGSDIEKILPPVSLFGGGRTVIKETVIERLQEFFNKYFGL